MPARDRSHYDRAYKVRSAQLRKAANADPSTRCWRCGRTLAEEQARQPDKVIVWHAGHTIDSDPLAALLPEHSTCNTSAGAIAGHLSRSTKGNRWW